MFCFHGFVLPLICGVWWFLQVYDGAQGWPFIEEASYKLLIETILSKQPGSAEEDQVKHLATFE